MNSAPGTVSFLGEQKTLDGIKSQWNTTISQLLGILQSLKPGMWAKVSNSSIQVVEARVSQSLRPSCLYREILSQKTKPNQTKPNQTKTKRLVYSSSLRINISRMFSYCCKTKHRGKYPLIKGQLFSVLWCQSALCLKTPKKTVWFSMASGSLPLTSRFETGDWLVGGRVVNAWEDHFQSPQEERNSPWRSS